ncbi:MAG: PilZ domain-containing protein [Candidatus Omnitrophica bacterium]|nr:PilZ domain-containing protein [Candidatus Omnitrophota bacterium]
MGIDDRRKYKRAFVKIRVECRGRRFWQYVETKDLSAGGMFLATDKVDEPQTRLEIIFEFEKGGEKKFVYAEGIVVWTRPQMLGDGRGEGDALPAGMGIMFTKLNPSTAKGSLESYIKELEGKEDA